MKRIITGGLLAVALLFPAALADDAAWSPETFTLDNGMEVVVVPDHRAPVVTHMVWYKVGAVDEDPGKSGLAHLFEHVMFKETENLGPERMVNLKINDDPKGPFISERDVVKEERRQRIENNPGAILQEQVLSALWKGHPYEITVIGEMDEVAALTPEDGMAFYEKYYSPENAILVVAGDVTADEVRAPAEATYGQIEPTGTVDGTRKWAPVPLLAETQLIVHADPKVRQPIWSRYYTGLSQTRQQRESYALDVGLAVLGGGMTSRLYQALVEDEQIAIDVNTYAWTTLHDEGPAVISASPVDGVSLEELDTAVMAQVREVLAEGFTDAEVVRARNSLAAEAIYGRDSQSAMANTFGSTLALGGTVDDILNYPDAVRSITTEEALAAVRKVFGEDRHYIESELVPAEGDQ